MAGWRSRFCPQPILNNPWISIPSSVTTNTGTISSSKATKPPSVDNQLRGTIIQSLKMMDAYAGGEEEGEEGGEKLRIIDGFRLYPRRWLMLALFSLLSLSNALAWISFAPISYHTGSPPPSTVCTLAPVGTHRA